MQIPQNVKVCTFNCCCSFSRIPKGQHSCFHKTFGVSVNATLHITVVSLVPSSDCFWKIKANENYTVFSNSATGCMIGTPESQWTRLQDGTDFMRAAPWESKRTTCDQELQRCLTSRRSRTKFGCTLSLMTRKKRRIPKHQFNTSRLFRSVKMPCKGSIIKKRGIKRCKYNGNLKESNAGPV